MEGDGCGEATGDGRGDKRGEVDDVMLPNLLSSGGLKGNTGTAASLLARAATDVVCGDTCSSTFGGGLGLAEGNFGGGFDGTGGLACEMSFFSVTQGADGQSCGCLGSCGRGFLGGKGFILLPLEAEPTLKSSLFGDELFEVFLPGIERLTSSLSSSELPERSSCLSLDLRSFPEITEFLIPAPFSILVFNDSLLLLQSTQSSFVFLAAFSNPALLKLTGFLTPSLLGFLGILRLVGASGGSLLGFGGNDGFAPGEVENMLST